MSGLGLPAAPARVGQAVGEVDTPALLVDLDALKRNLRRMVAALVGQRVRLRPHAKTHKSPDLAAKQIALGAVGVCVQKVSEAERMVDAGIGDVLVSNEIVGAPKLARLGALARRARLAVCVDDPGNAWELSRAMVAADAAIDVLVEINVGADRCGVDPGAPAVSLARHVASLPGLRFAGLQAYHGSAQHLRAHAERRAAVESAAAKAGATKAAIEAAGLAVPIVSGAGTGTFRFEAASGLWNELQPGSYVFMDADYARNRVADGAPFAEFEQALHVLATVMSRPAPDRAIVDAGLKALAVDSGLPLVAGRDGVEYAGASDEHGRLRIAAGAAPLAVGDKLRLVPGHCDPTVNLHDWYVGCRGGRVECLWPIARGPGF